MKKIRKGLLFILSILFLAVTMRSALAGDILVNEVMANPSGTDPYDNEWIEIYNNGTIDINLSGYNITDGEDVFTLPNINLSSDDFLVLVNNQTAFNQTYSGIDSIEYGIAAANLQLNNSGEFIEIYDSAGTLIENYTYPSAAAHEDESYGRYPDGTGNKLFMLKPSPGLENDIYAPSISWVNPNSSNVYRNGILNLTINSSDLVHTVDNVVVTINGTNQTMNYDGSVYYYEWNTTNFDGKHNLTAYANDTIGLTNSSKLYNITIDNTAPVANAGIDQTVPEGSIVQFNGSQSYDASTSIVSYLWNFTDGTNSTLANPQKQFNDSGVYNISLAVTDFMGYTNTDYVSINITEVNPNANITANSTSFPEDSSVLLNASLSTGNIGDELNISYYEWDFSYNGTFAADYTSNVSYATYNGYTLNGTYTAAVKVFDEDTSSIASISLNVTFVNDAPVYTPILAQNVNEDNTTSLSLLTTASDEEDAQINLTHSCISNNSNVILSYNNTDKNLTITATNDYYGTAQINCTVFDTMGKNGTTNFLVNVLPVNDAPVVNFSALNATFNEDTIFTINLSKYVNDVDNSTDQLTWTNSSNTNIAVAINDTTKIATLAPNLNWNGQENITFIASDGIASNNNTVLVTVLPVNDAPVINMANYFGLQEDFPSFVLDLNANRSDVDNPAASLDWNVEGVNSTLISITKLVGFNYLFTIVPVNNSYGINTVNFTLSDGSLTAKQAVTFNISSVNDAPNFTSALPDYTAVEDAVSYANLSSFLADVDNTPSQLNIVTNSTRAYGSGNQLVFNFTTGSANYYEYVIVYVTDGSLNSSDTVRVNVTYANDAPVFAQIPAQQVAEDSGTFSFNVSPYVNDEEGNAVAFNISNENTSRVDCNINGNNITLTPFANWFGTGVNAASCSVYAYETAAGGISNTITFSINVTPVDDNTTFTGSIGPLSWNEDNSYTYNLANNFINIDGDALTYNYLAAPQNITVAFAGNNVTFTPNPNWFGTRYIIINATDGTSAAQSNNITLTVNSVNDAPVIAVPAQTQNEDTGPYAINLSIYANDVDNSTDQLSYYVVGDYPTKVDCNISGQILTYTLMPNFQGITNCSVVASDRLANSSVNTFQITVNNINDLPVFSGTIGPLTWNEDTNYTLNLSQYFTDADGQNLGFTATPATNITININNLTGIATLIPDKDFSGTRYTVFTATDSLNTTSSNNVTLNVLAVNDDPPIVNFGGLTVYINEDSYNDTINLSNYVTDADTPLDQINWSRVDTTANIITNINNQNKIINISGVPNYNGINAIILRASDGVNSNIGSITVNIASVPDAPVITPVAPQTINVGAPFSLTVNATDPDGDTITFSDNTNLFNITNAGLISFTPTLAQVGNHTINITATDSTSRSSSILFNLNIVGQNNAPVCNNIPPQNWTEDNALNNAFDLDTYCSDPDGAVLTYIASTIDNPNINVAIGVGNVVSFSQPANWNGVEYVVFTASDGINTTNTNSVMLTVTGDNDLPTSVTFSPDYNPKITENGVFTFNTTVVDPDSTAVVRWFLNATLVNTGASYTFVAPGKGTYTLTAIVVDGNYTNSKIWTITATDVPIAATFNGATTNFSAIPDLANAQNVILEKTQYGKIEFTSPLDLSNVVDLDACVRIDDKVAGIDTACLPGFINKTAKITLKNIRYNSKPKIYYDNGFTTAYANINTECTFCTVTEYDNPPQNAGTVKFNVNHFTVFTAKEGTNASMLKINDLDAWVDDDKVSGIDNDGGNIDEVKPGSRIKITLEIKNDFSSDNGTAIKNIDIDGTLYDIDDGDNLDESDEISKLSPGKKEKVTLTFEVPDSVEEDDFQLTIIVEGRDENKDYHRATAEFTVKVEKDSHDLRIKRGELSLASLSCLRSTSIDYEILNAGSDDEDDVVITAKSDTLGVNYKKSGISLQTDPDDDNIYTGTVSIDVSKDVKAGTYPIILNTYYDTDRLGSSKTVNLVVTDCVETKAASKEDIQVEMIGGAPAAGFIPSTTTELGDQSDFTQSSTFGMLMIIALILAAGFIIFEVGAIYIVVNKRIKKKKMLEMQKRLEEKKAAEKRLKEESNQNNKNSRKPRKK